MPLKKPNRDEREGFTREGRSWFNDLVASRPSTVRVKRGESFEGFTDSYTQSFNVFFVVPARVHGDEK